MKASANTAWSVRQLYYACDEQRPRLYDQGLAGFLLGTHDPAIGYVSVIFLPDTAAQALERAALNNRLGLSLLGTTYSANAYAFGLQYQNCNQWLIEMLASAWGEWGAAELTRKQAQAWLRGAGYEPISFDVSSRVLMWLGSLLPWLHDDDHPSEDLQQQIYRVSMPASIEAFVRATVPGAMRVEFCHAGSHAVVHRGWDALAEGCRPGEGDTLIALD